MEQRVDLNLPGSEGFRQKDEKLFNEICDLPIEVALRIWVKKHPEDTELCQPLVDVPIAEDAQ